MRRLLVVFVTFALGSGAALWCAVHWWGDAALAEGRALHDRRAVMHKLVAHLPPARQRQVLFLGDSTLMVVPGNPSWAHRLGGPLRAQRVAAVYDALPGQDVFHHFCMLPALVAHHPAAVVVVANPRVMARGRRTGREINLCSFRPLATLPRALLLPWHDRGVSLVRLALTRTLATPWVEDAFFIEAGLRQLVANAWSPTDAARRRRRSLAEGFRIMARHYDEPLTRRHPSVRMLGAVTREIRRAGAAPIVVMTPVPFDAIATVVPHDPAVWRRRMTEVRGVIEAAGGDFVDAHDLVAAGDFRDRSGHLAPRGHVRVANVVAPLLYRRLGLPPPRALPLPPPQARRRPARPRRPARRQPPGGGVARP